MASTEQQSVRSEPASDTGEDGREWRPGLDPHDQARLAQAKSDPFTIVEEIPTKKSSLGWFSVSCLIFNRMIGSGVFNSSSVIYSNTQSIGVSIMIWLVGISMALSGVILYIELGLTVPRYRLGGSKEKTAVVRSGGELPYLNYFFKLPRFLATCVFGVSFIVFGNTSVNSIAFALAILQATKQTADESSDETSAAGSREAVVCIAIAANTFACLLHSMSRKWGIRLNNLLGTLKLMMLFLIIIFGFNSLRLDNAESKASGERSRAVKNFDDPFNTESSPKHIYKYAEAVLFVIFPLGGFHQANYVGLVLAEIRHPRRNFAVVSGFSVLLICCLMMTVNTLYAAIIPKETLLERGHDQALEYFKYAIGQLGPAKIASDKHTVAINGSFRALSAMGNVIVFTFTAARVKQELAKEGVLPFSLFFASSYSFTLRRGFQRLPQTREGYQLHSSRAPAAALALHWAVTTVLIIGTVFGIKDATSHYPIYYLMVASYAYGLDVVWFAVIGIAMLYFRLWPGSRWRYKSPIPHAVGIVAATVFTATNAFPLVAIWIKDPEEDSLVKTEGLVRWFASQTFVFSVLGAGVLYWLAFRFYVYQRKTKTGDELEVTRIPIFWRDRSSAGGGERGSGYEGELLLLYEIIKVRWRSYRRGEEKTPMVAEPMHGEVRDSVARSSTIPFDANVARMSGGRGTN
ncbi:amino acid permease-domain-containing protein [Immersiella caudata]|uniref:Amino acid permease-domain-containing protein n=1 Tax=Immersiella caudata TaxID=314043 RepID=A0AA40CD48_9PEZI|nr:amino acid permease-domain-containing protein [Immersiella caudata]